jgi:hypothetical protein
LTGRQSQQQRRLNITRSRQVFQIEPALTQVTYDDIEDALTASQKLTVPQKREYFYSQGIDYDNVSKYYEKLRLLEAILTGKNPNQNDDIMMIFKCIRSWF